MTRTHCGRFLVWEIGVECFRRGVRKASTATARWQWVPGESHITAAGIPETFFPSTDTFEDHDAVDTTLRYIPLPNLGAGRPASTFFLALIASDSLHSQHEQSRRQEPSLSCLSALFACPCPCFLALARLCRPNPQKLPQFPWLHNKQTPHPIVKNLPLPTYKIFPVSLSA
jgi:hypothetical protein